MVIIDDNIGLADLDSDVKSDEEVGEDAPVVAAFIDERPEIVQKMEEFRESKRWRTIGPDEDDAQKEVNIEKSSLINQKHSESIDLLPDSGSTRLDLLRHRVKSTDLEKRQGSSREHLYSEKEDSSAKMKEGTDDVKLTSIKSKKTSAIDSQSFLTETQQNSEKSQLHTSKQSLDSEYEEMNLASILTDVSKESSSKSQELHSSNSPSCARKNLSRKDQSPIQKDSGLSIQSEKKDDISNFSHQTGNDKTLDHSARQTSKHSNNDESKQDYSLFQQKDRNSDIDENNLDLAPNQGKSRNSDNDENNLNHFLVKKKREDLHCSPSVDKDDASDDPSFISDKYDPESQDSEYCHRKKSNYIKSDILSKSSVNVDVNQQDLFSSTNTNFEDIIFANKNDPPEMPLDSKEHSFLKTSVARNKHPISSELTMNKYNLLEPSSQDKPCTITDLSPTHESHMSKLSFHHRRDYTDSSSYKYKDSFELPSSINKHSPDLPSTYCKDKESSELSPHSRHSTESYHKKSDLVDMSPAHRKYSHKYRESIESSPISTKNLELANISPAHSKHSVESYSKRNKIDSLESSPVHIKHQDSFDMSPSHGKNNDSFEASPAHSKHIDSFEISPHTKRDSLDTSPVHSKHSIEGSPNNNEGNLNKHLAVQSKFQTSDSDESPVRKKPSSSDSDHSQESSSYLLDKHRKRHHSVIDKSAHSKQSNFNTEMQKTNKNLVSKKHKSQAMKKPQAADFDKASHLEHSPVSSKNESLESNNSGSDDSESDSSSVSSNSSCSDSDNSSSASKSRSSNSDSSAHSKCHDSETEHSLHYSKRHDTDSDHSSLHNKEKKKSTGSSADQPSRSHNRNSEMDDCSSEVRNKRSSSNKYSKHEETKKSESPIIIKQRDSKIKRSKHRNSYDNELENLKKHSDSDQSPPRYRHQDSDHESAVIKRRKQDPKEIQISIFNKKGNWERDQIQSHKKNVEDKLQRKELGARSDQILMYKGRADSKRSLSPMQRKRFDSENNQLVIQRKHHSIERNLSPVHNKQFISEENLSPNYRKPYHFERYPSGVRKWQDYPEQSPPYRKQYNYHDNQSPVRRRRYEGNEDRRYEGNEDLPPPAYWQRYDSGGRSLPAYQRQTHNVRNDYSYQRFPQRSQNFSSSWNRNNFDNDFFLQKPKPKNDYIEYNRPKKYDSKFDTFPEKLPSDYKQMSSKAFTYKRNVKSRWDSDPEDIPPQVRNQMPEITSNRMRSDTSYISKHEDKEKWQQYPRKYDDNLLMKKQKDKQKSSPKIKTNLEDNDPSISKRKSRNDIVEGTYKLKKNDDSNYLETIHSVSGRDYKKKEGKQYVSDSDESKALLTDDLSLSRKKSKKVSLDDNFRSGEETIAPQKNLRKTENSKSSSTSKVAKEILPLSKVQQSDEDSDFVPRQQVKEISSLEVKESEKIRTHGLKSAQEVREELKISKEKELQKLEKLGKKSGKRAETVFRDVSGKKRNIEEELEVKNKLTKEAEKEKKEIDDKYKEWGKGLKQREMQSHNLSEAMYEVNKPFARHADDADLDKMLREQDREGDPMLDFITKKKRKKEEPGKELPKYKGPVPPPNRFNIAPGYRWDGVDRSNGYEKDFFMKKNTNKAKEEEAYKWSVENM